MSEPPIEENISLKTVGESDANIQQPVKIVETKIETIEDTKKTSVDGYTPPENDNKKKLDKDTDVIDKLFMYYVKKGIINRKQIKEKRGNIFKNTLSENNNKTEDLVNSIAIGKKSVYQIIKACAITPKKELSHPFLATTQISGKNNDIYAQNSDTASNIRDSSYIPTTPWAEPIPQGATAQMIYDTKESKDFVAKFDTFSINNDGPTIKSTLKNTIYDVTKSNITDVESLTTKNRIEYADKIETDSKQMILLNFEDDSFRPVIKISDQHIEIINKWYNICNQLMEIEETNIRIPNIINNSDMSTILYKNINCKHKDLFVQSYVPEILNNITAQNKIRTMESQMSICNAKETSISAIKKSQTISDLSISIPKNMSYNEDYFYKKGNNIILCPKYKKSSVAVNGQNNKSASTRKCDSIISDVSNKLNGDIDVLNAIKKEETTQFFGTLNLIPEKAYGSEEDTIFTFNSCPIIAENGYAAYNAEHNGLNPPFGSNMQLLGDIGDRFDDVIESTASKLIIVLINPLFLQTVVLVEPDLLTLETIFGCTEYGFIELFTVKSNKEEIKVLIEKQYDCIVFNNTDEINQALLSTSSFIEFIKNKQNNDEPLLEEDKSVKKYLRKYFEISNDINKKMKASALYDTITRSDLCKIDKPKMSGFRNRLSTYLKDLGLQKKRYNDGYYYYGIVAKDLIRYQSSSANNREMLTIDKMENDRALLINEMSTNGSNFFTVKIINDQDQTMQYSFTP